MTGILDLRAFDPATEGLLGRADNGLLSRLPPTPAHEFARVLWRGAQSLAPNLTGLLAGEPPPLPDVPQMTPTGKIPSTEDPRIWPAFGEAADIVMNLLPMGAAAVAKPVSMAARLARAAPAMAQTGMREAESLASKSARLYNPPVKLPRPFAADYPSGATADATGRLTADIEGRPLRAEYVAGRRVVGGPDEPLGPQEVVAAATQASGTRPKAVTARELGGEARRVVKETDRRGGQSDYYLLWNRGLSRVQAERVIAHELGHITDDMAGGIPTAGLTTELRQVYNTLNTGTERARHLTGPQHLGYRGEDVAKELMAEAIRAYMADPNYLKTVAPKTAAAIRAAVNAHPTLSKIVQFNTLAAPVAMGALGALEQDNTGP